MKIELPEGCPLDLQAKLVPILIYETGCRKGDAYFVSAILIDEVRKYYENWYNSQP